MKSSIVVCILLSLLYGCRQTFTDVDELNAFVNDESNGHKFTNSVNGVEFVLLHKPTDLMVAQELRDNVTPARVDALSQKYSRNIYFTLSMSINDMELLNTMVRDKYKYNELVNKLLFTMDHSVFFISNSKDTLPMLDSNYPRMYGLSKSTTILMVFPRDKAISDDAFSDFILKDIGLETGDLKFRIDNNIFKSEPQLKFK